MLDFDYVKIAVSIALAVCGWMFAHSRTSKRDIANKRRELQIQYLIDAYRVLINEISQREATKERSKLLENVITDVQLFGTGDQVELAKKLASDICENKEFELDPLINSLRDELRQELNIENVSGNVQWLRGSE